MSVPLYVPAIAVMVLPIDLNSKHERCLYIMHCFGHQFASPVARNLDTIKSLRVQPERNSEAAVRNEIHIALK